MLFKNITILFGIILFLKSSLFSQVVSVEEVKFSYLKNNWLVGEVEISTATNNDPKATSDKFAENVIVRLYVAFENSKTVGNLDYFVSQADIMILEKGDKNVVRFFIPDKVIKMNRYRLPKYFYAELTVDKKVQKFDSRAFSSNFNNIESINSFMQKARQGMAVNQGRLMPSYNVPLK